MTKKEPFFKGQISKVNNSSEEEEEKHFPLTKLNFILMAISAAAIIIGFLLMLGEGSSDQNGFVDDIFSTRRIVIGPIIAFLGFIFMGFSIIYRRNEK